MPPEAVTSSLTVEIEAATMYERARLDARKALAVETARLRTDGRAGGN
jgi:hypothetical protein